MKPKGKRCPQTVLLLAKNLGRTWTYSTSCFQLDSCCTAELGKANLQILLQSFLIKQQHFAKAFEQKNRKQVQNWKTLKSLGLFLNQRLLGPELRQNGWRKGEQRQRDNDQSVSMAQIQELLEQQKAFHRELLQQQESRFKACVCTIVETCNERIDEMPKDLQDLRTSSPFVPIISLWFFGFAVGGFLSVWIHVATFSDSSDRSSSLHSWSVSCVCTV